MTKLPYLLTFSLTGLTVLTGLTGCSQLSSSSDQETKLSEKLTYDQRQISKWDKASQEDGKALGGYCESIHQMMNVTNLGIWGCVAPVAPKPDPAQQPTPTPVPTPAPAPKK